MLKPETHYRDYVLLGLFAAIIFVLALTPIGFINLVFIKATIIQVPVIIGSIVLGPKRGAVLGGCFALASLIANTTAPSMLSFAFSPLMPVPGLGRGSPLALLVCFLPRIAVGILPALVYRAMMRIPKLRDQKNKKAIFITSGALGSLINTILVMWLIVLLFGDAYAALKGVGVNALFGAVVASVGLQSVLEAVISALLAMLICPVLMRFAPNAGESGTSRRSLAAQVVEQQNAALRELENADAAQMARDASAQDTQPSADTADKQSQEEKK